MRETESVCLCVCVCKRESERERERNRECCPRAVEGACGSQIIPELCGVTSRGG